MPGDMDYPPQYADSCVAGVVGQINDFAGPYESDSLSAPAPATAKGGAQSLGHGRQANDPGVPVVITGFKTPAGEALPGLRESLIASTIIKLIAHLPPTNPLREEIRKSALQLYAQGGDKISAYGRAPKPGKGSKKQA
jgi:hypothetical protein